MDPISLAIGAVGLGMSLFGGLSGASNAKEQAKVSADEAQQEQGINDQKQQAMEIDARRKSLETIRHSQQAQAMALASATSQGAQFGSGLQGGLAEVQSESNFNLAGINSSLQIGRNINQYNKNISADKMQMSSLGGQAATDQAITSIGGSLMKIGPTIGSLTKGMNLSTGFGGPYV